MTDIADVYAAPEDLALRRAYADAHADTPHGQFVHLQLARHTAPEGWSLEAAEEECRLGFELAEAPFAGIEGATVQRYRLGFPQRVHLDPQAALRPDLWRSPAWATVEELDLCFDEVPAEFWRAAPLAACRTVRLFCGQVALLTDGLERAGLLDAARIERVQVIDFLARDQTMWPALDRLPKLSELDLELGYDPELRLRTLPEGAFARIRAVGGDLFRQPAWWSKSPSVTCARWGTHGMDFEAQREPGQRFRTVTMRPGGGWSSVAWLGAVTSKVEARDAGGHDDDRNKILRGVFDGMPGAVESVQVVEGLEVPYGPRLLRPTTRKNLAQHLERDVNPKRTVPMTLSFPPELPKKPPKRRAASKP